MSLTRPFSNLNKNDAHLAGGKGASLGEMLQAGIPVPDGFVVLSDAFEYFIKESDLVQDIEAILENVNHKAIHTVEDASAKIQEIILNANLPKDLEEEILNNFNTLNSEFVAVRSSATAEDGADHAWAGQLDSYLNTTKEDLLQKVKECFASLFTPRAIFYRFEKGLHTTHISVAVVVQKMVNSEKSGIAFSVHPVTEDYNQLIIEAGFGLGEAIVSGSVTPDSYVVEKNPQKIIDINVSEQTRALFRKEGGGNEWKDLGTLGGTQVFEEKDILELANLIMHIENHYGFPCDIEWAYEAGKFYIVQSRPITTLKEVEKVSEKSLVESLRGIDWDIQRFNAYPFFLSSAATLSGFKLVWGLKYKHFLMISHNKNIEWHYDRDDYSRIGKIFWDKIKTLDDLSVLMNEYRETYNTSTKSAQYKENELGGYSVEDLQDLLHKQIESMCASGGIAHIIECVTYVAEQKLINEYHIDPANIKSSEISFLKRAELYAHDLCSSGKSDKDILKEFKEKYAWMQSSYLGRNEVSIESIYELSHKSVVEISSPNEKIKKGNNEEFLEILSHIFSWQDERKGNLLESIYLSQPVLEILADKVGVSREAIKFLLPEEIEKVTDKEFQKLLIERSNLFVDYAPSNLNRTSLIGQEAQRFIDEFVKITINNDGILRGQVAFTGHVKGIVRVCLSLESIENFKHGEVLVASMTRPEYVAAMKKAIAFITNEGGITCHAAIIAREMKKPCIIGTKFATQILKDGDLVEVDADNGVVRIISHE